MYLIKDCEFCDKFPTDQVPLIEETEHFIVKADRSPLLIGHLLICSKTHFGCAGELPPEHREELTQIITRYQQKMLDVFGHVSMYEHGRAGHCVPMANGQGMCEHFHLHMLPFSKTVVLPFDEHDHRVLAVQHADRFEAVYAFFERHGNYLYVSSQTDDHRFYCVEDSAISSHFLRSCFIACGVQQERDDWLNCQNIEEQGSTYENFK